MGYSIGVVVGPDAQSWLVVYDERVPGTLPPSDPGRYVYVPISPVGAPQWTKLVPGASWLSFDALLSGVSQAQATPPKQVGPTIMELAPPLQTGGGGVWLTPNQISRVTFPIEDVVAGNKADLTLILDGRFGQIGISRSDRPISSSRTFPLSVLF